MILLFFGPRWAELNGQSLPECSPTCMRKVRQWLLFYLHHTPWRRLILLSFVSSFSKPFLCRIRCQEPQPHPPRQWDSQRLFILCKIKSPAFGSASSCSLRNATRAKRFFKNFKSFLRMLIIDVLDEDVSLQILVTLLTVEVVIWETLLQYRHPRPQKSWDFFSKWYGLWGITETPANQLSGLKTLWVFPGYGLSQVWVVLDH